MDMDMTKDQVIEIIRVAFEAVNRPPETMADAEVADDRGDESSRFEETDRHWWEIPTPILKRCSAPFCFLPSISMPYYLPAYMSWHLATDGGRDSFSSESLIYYLSDPNRGGKIIDLLTSEQKTGIRSFLDFAKANIADDYDMEYFIKALALFKDEAQQTVEPLPHARRPGHSEG
jgi:hypothetical protein